MKLRYLAMIPVVLVVGCEGPAEEAVRPGDTTATAAEPAPSMMVARGHEPGWMVTLTGDSIVYIGRYGQDTVRARIGGVVTQDGRTTWTTSPDAGLTVTATREGCTDGATGMPHPFAVRVARDTATVQGCGGDPASLLTGGPWTVRVISGDTVTATAPTMQFDETGRVSGTTSCNQYSGPYTLTGEGLAFGPVIATKRACEAPLMQQEQRFLQVLAMVARFELPAPGELRLLTNDGGSIVARRN